MKSSRYLILTIVLITFAAGCAVPLWKHPKEPLEVSNKYLRIGQTKEAGGDMVAALEQYRLALTLDPKSEEAEESRRRVEIALYRSAREHYEAGLALHRKGKYDSARHNFLIALRLWPDYPEAIDMITSRKRIRVKRYIVHTIKPGESLSKVAFLYYGDHSRFPIIAQYNDLTDATHMRVGDEIKVPEIEGMEFLVGEEVVKTEEIDVPDTDLWDLEDDGAEIHVPEPLKTVEPEEEQAIDRLALFRDQGVELFKDKKYTEAIIEFNKVLEVNPEDIISLDYTFKSHFQGGVALFRKKRYPQAIVKFNKALKVSPEDKSSLDYLFKSHFQYATALFGKKDYLAAKDQFKVCLLYERACRKCHEYIITSEDLYKETHYKTGMKCFDEERLVEAIEEWGRVMDLDPSYKRVEYLIKKAKTILKNIEEIRDSQKNG